MAKSTAPATPARSIAGGTAASPEKPATPDTARPAPGMPDGKPAHTRVLMFYTFPREMLAKEVRSIPATNQERLARLREEFAAADCDSSHMKEQPVVDKHGTAGTNLICTWPGASPDMIVIAAHYDHEGSGQGALADWSGAALLPFLYKAFQGQPRDNTFVFLESWKREGADTWLKSLDKIQRKRIRAVIDLDALGLSYTRFFTNFSPFENVPPGSTHLQAELLWAALDDGLTQAPEQTSPRHWLSADITDPFRAYMVPTIIIHSVPVDSAHIPGSAADVAKVIDPDAYFTTYHLMCAYIASVDRVADRLDTSDHLWDTGPAEVHPEQETPLVTFRTFSHGQLQNAPPVPVQ
ncbi:MAG: M28 family peptidase [Acidobacteriaceae bacterium]